MASLANNYDNYHCKNLHADVLFHAVAMYRFAGSPENNDDNSNQY